MSNFRLNLPIDIPWRLVNCSKDMMDITFCNKVNPSPFRSSIALYIYEPRPEDIPETYSDCGQQITYLKVSCSITGYQPSGNEKEQITDLLSSINDLDYSKIEDILSDYFGCYGVLLNVSVHPEEKDKADLKKYPHIIDFEPKLRDFYQAATETGEVLTSSFGKVNTNKSFGTTDSTESSWKGGADITIPSEITTAATGVPADVGINGSTGQTRTETDQANWGINTDASRERREGQSNSTQLSQMYNLLTGYHSGTNRCSFMILPRPHILQPTDRRTFTQGLRVIEGIQDFFLIVLRESNQTKLRVDVNLQTGHFPEVTSLTSPAEKIKFEEKKVDFTLQKRFFHQDIFNGTVKRKTYQFTKSVDEINDEWEVYLDKEDTIRGIKEEIISESSPPPNLSNDKGSEPLHRSDPNPSYTWDRYINSTDFKIDAAQLIVDVEYTVEDGKWWYHDAYVDRKYSVYLKKKNNEILQHADNNDLLITQRKLCTEILFNTCISGNDVTSPKSNDIWDNDFIVVDEPTFDVDDLFKTITGISVLPNIASINSDIVKGKVSNGPVRSDFAFKKALIRRIQNKMLSSASSPFKYEPGKVGYLQTKTFQKKLLQVLPEEILQKPIQELNFINLEVRNKVSKNISLKEILSSNDYVASKQFGISKHELLNVKKPGANK